MNSFFLFLVISQVFWGCWWLSDARQIDFNQQFLTVFNDPSVQTSKITEGTEDPLAFDAPFSASNGNSSCNFPDEQLYALYDLYKSTDGEKWLWRRPSFDPFSGVKWNFTQDNPNPCIEKWAGIKCSFIEINVTCNVTHLHLHGYDLYGTLPNSVNKLVTLQELDLGLNRLFGSIPDSITELTDLKVLDLGTNNFNDSIPSTLGNLHSLQILDMTRNSLQGPFPDSLQYLKRLTYLNISSNNITDEIPTIFLNLSSIEVIDISLNNLYGTIPDWISQISTLKVLQISDNMFGGEIPLTIGNFQSLEKLDMSNNSLLGTLPLQFSNLTKLLQLNIGNNVLYGELQSSLFLNWKSMRSLKINNNFFNGTFPFDTVCNTMTELLELTISFNYFTGTIPDYVNKLKYIEILRFSNNYIQGSIPDSIGELKHLRHIETYYNVMNGSLPNSLGNLSNLITFDVGKNSYTGTIPSSLCNMRGLRELAVDHCYLSGTIPQCVGRDLFGLVDFLVQGNDLTGTIPSNFNNLSSIVNFYVYGNKLTGTLPQGFGNNFYFTEQMDLHDNLLSGTMPSSMCNMYNMLYLYLSQNLYYGELPNCIGDMTFMYQLFTEYNSFSGTLPISLQKFRHVDALTFNSNAFTGTIAPEIYVMGEHLLGMLLDNNFFTGTIPDEIASLSRIRVLNMSNNSMTGSLPWGMSNMTSLISLDLSSNSFTGNIPSGTLSAIPFLRSIFLEDNFFSGALANVFNTSHTTVYGDIDVSSNYFTGSLDSELFTNSPNLVTFAAVKNCITGSIPDSICSCKFARAIALDGLHAASHCQNRIFPNIPSIHTYLLTKDVQGTIPTCLFSMPILKTLHLSGNGIQGSLSSSIVIGSHLTELSLSHNLLKGTIPHSFQNRVFTNLDLSFNQLNGELDNNFASYPIDNSSLALQVNRLSGTIPSSILNLQNISILQGNIFSCIHGDSSLPKHDEYMSSYVCGSDSVNAAIAVWLVAFTVLIIAIILYLYYLRKYIEERVGRWLDAIVTWWSVFDDPQVLYDATTVPTLEAGRDPSTATRSPSVATLGRMRSTSIAVLFRNTGVVGSAERPTVSGEEATKELGEAEPTKSPNPLSRTNVFIQAIMLIRSTLFDTSGLNMTTKSKTDDGKVNYIFRFGLLLGRLRKVVAHIMTMLVFVLMPTYVILNALYSMYEHAYAWQVGLAFISGVIPALILFELFVLFSVRIYYILKVWLFDSYVEEILIGRLKSTAGSKSISKDGEDDGVFKRNLLKKQQIDKAIRSAKPWFYFKEFIILLVNCIIVLIVNMAYVSATTIEINKILLLFIILLVSIFKIVWGNYAVVRLFRSILLQSFEQANDEEKERELNNNNTTSGEPINSVDSALGTGSNIQQAVLERFTSSSLRFLVYLSIFNNVIAPSIAAMLVSPNCFYYMLAESPAVTVSYEFVHCVEFISTTVTNTCGKLGFATHTTSYSPPYNYSYQCSSALMTSFTDIFIYRYVFSGLVMPLIMFLLKYLQGYFYRKWQQEKDGEDDEIPRSSDNYGPSSFNHKLFVFVSGLLPMIIRPIDSSNNAVVGSDEERGTTNTVSISNPMLNSMNAPATALISSPDIGGRKGSTIATSKPPSNSIVGYWNNHHQSTTATTNPADAHDLSKDVLDTIDSDAHLFLLPKDKKSRKMLFNKDIFTVGFVGDLAVLMTFGAIFPPLAIVIFFNILIHTFLTQILMGRFIQIAKALVQKSSTAALYLLPLVDFLNDECRDVGRLIFDSIPTIAVLAAIFWSFALFDTLADAAGTKHAIWILIVMALMPFWIVGLGRLYRGWIVFYNYILWEVFGEHGDKSAGKGYRGRQSTTSSAYRASEFSMGDSERDGSFLSRPSYATSATGPLGEGLSERSRPSSNIFSNSLSAKNGRGGDEPKNEQSSNSVNQGIELRASTYIST